MLRSRTVEIFTSLVIRRSNSDIMNLVKIKHSHILLISVLNVTQAKYRLLSVRGGLHQYWFQNQDGNRLLSTSYLKNPAPRDFL